MPASATLLFSMTAQLKRKYFAPRRRDSSRCDRKNRLGRRDSEARLGSGGADPTRRRRFGSEALHDGGAV